MHFSAAKSRETTDSVSFEFADMLTQVLLFTVATCNALVVPARAPAPRMGLSKGDDFPKAALRNIGVQVSAAATHPLAQSLRLGSPTRDHAFPTHALRQLAALFRLLRPMEVSLQRWLFWVEYEAYVGG